MNFFSKNKVVFWLLVFLVVLNLSALATFIIFFSTSSPGPNEMTPGKSCSNFCRELSLTPDQSAKVSPVLAKYRNQTDPVSASIRDQRLLVLDELAKDDPDTLLLSQYTRNISSLQEQLQKASIHQYFELKKICTPDQCRKLTSLYSELYGCKECGMGKGSGKGMMYRHGQERQRGCCDSGSTAGNR